MQNKMKAYRFHKWPKAQEVPLCDDGNSAVATTAGREAVVATYVQRQNLIVLKQQQLLALALVPNQCLIYEHVNNIPT